jgi:hypothetical protein
MNYKIITEGINIMHTNFSSGEIVTINKEIKTYMGVSPVGSLAYVTNKTKPSDETVSICLGSVCTNVHFDDISSIHMFTRWD